MPQVENKQCIRGLTAVEQLVGQCLKGTQIQMVFQVLHSRVIPLALPTNIRVGRKAFPGTNAPAYYENA